MTKHILIAATLLQAALAAACAAQPAATSGTLFCQADSVSKQSLHTAIDTGASAASSFCADLQTAFAQTLGSPVAFASKADAEWVITVGVLAYRADAAITHSPSGQTETLQFDIMDASLTAERMRPFANDVASVAIGLR
jgi:hypothetical protein